ncbi:MAG: HEAT repeat domain-containing protein [Candidatus Binataceae bacterium]|nr:HEAT repeat domain-containing protein [Candidatus Binataceae bacterium]
MCSRHRSGDVSAQIRDAGLDQAIRLAGSKSPEDRQFATELLGAIGTPRVRDYLEKLSQDPNPEVMIFAKYCLGRIGKGPMKLVADAFKHVATYKR